MGKYSKIASNYRYMVINISEGEDLGFTAVIPKFPKMYIYADSPEELHKTVRILIEEEIERLKKEKLPIPKPDKNCICSGYFVVRIKPEIHERLAYLAEAENTSLNQYVNRIFEDFTGAK